jgi:uncharacterized SAM-binding protein YcdF (DUF218 family)
MSFFVSKVLWELVRPSTLLLLTTALGTLLLWSRWHHLGRNLVSVSLLLVLLPAVLPLASVLERPLENYFPQPALPARVDGVIVLGGAETPVRARRGGRSCSTVRERLLKGLELARRYREQGSSSAAARARFSVAASAAPP